MLIAFNCKIDNFIYLHLIIIYRKLRAFYFVNFVLSLKIVNNFSLYLNKFIVLLTFLNAL